MRPPTERGAAVALFWRGFGQWNAQEVDAADLMDDGQGKALLTLGRMLLSKHLALEKCSSDKVQKAIPGEFRAWLKGEGVEACAIPARPAGLSERMETKAAIRTTPPCGRCKAVELAQFMMACLVAMIETPKLLRDLVDIARLIRVLMPKDSSFGARLSDDPSSRVRRGGTQGPTDASTRSCGESSRRREAIPR
jgi:hypothetical protein